ncbi:hypothetical protein A2U01_0062019 [Trifolium medium]|uniref:Uncharacterized protein n=1 Tax=Trifolium medium TaxID=97028 RepID=A0A392RYY2_9FABA|nr:hypothetical protein [Trifolium medium]
MLILNVFHIRISRETSPIKARSIALIVTSQATLLKDASRSMVIRLICRGIMVLIMHQLRVVNHPMVTMKLKHSKLLHLHSLKINLIN